MIGIYDYTVILTYIGMLSGFKGITFAFAGEQRSALFCLIISGICDMFDGKIAFTRERTLKEKSFGIQIDSLSDLICFGVLPAAIVYNSQNQSEGSFYISAFYLLCALIRLSWFNVDEGERQTRENGRRKDFIGLPVTTAALIFPLIIEIGNRFNWQMTAILPVIMLVTAAGFLMPLRIRKPVFSWKSHIWLVGVFGILLTGAFILKR